MYTSGLAVDSDLSEWVSGYRAVCPYYEGRRVWWLLVVVTVAEGIGRVS